MSFNELTKRVVASTAVSEDLYAVESPAIQLASCIVTHHPLDSHIDMGTVWGEKLLTCLCREASVQCVYDKISNRYIAIAALELPELGGQLVLLNVLGPVPGHEEAHLPEVAIVGQIKLWTKGEDLAVKAQGSCVVPAVPVQHRKSDIDDYAMKGLVRQDLVE